ncbi:MAG: universal stress protein [Desulfobacterales bacterium]|nr:universal stress protein [Desulfobacterales bacterium]
MELATSLARIEKSELHVVQAWETPLPGFGRISQSEVDKLTRKFMAEHKERLAELMERCAPHLPKERFILLKGNAGDLIPALAKSKGIELIVMGTLCRTGIAGFYHGNRPERFSSKLIVLC